ncbi:MAG: hypothetical protein JNL92_24605 [Opitutaceae bacterium]|nr:hypothetical protein [Opitutaceae bacterium]
MRLVAVCLVAALAAVRCIAAEPAVVMMQSAPGRFEVAALDPTGAHAIVAEAEEAWRVLAGPLGLPGAFLSPVYVRVEPEPALVDRRPAGPPFRVAVEAGGLVSVRLRHDALAPVNVRRALIQGLLLRVAVARHGVTPHLTAPLWLELGCLGWWRTRADGAQLDALKQAAARQPPPAIGALLLWQRGGEESGAWSEAATWLLTFLQAESGAGQEWPTLLARLLAGDDPLIALVQTYPGRYRDPVDRELWWQTGYHQARRGRTLPVLEAAESRLQLGALARFVAAGAGENTDRVVPVRELMARVGEPLVGVEVARRAEQLARLVPSLHPFYRNAGLSLADVLAARAVKPARLAELCTTFEEDWRNAAELEQATAAALDRLEAR